MAASSGPLNSSLFAEQLSAFGGPQIDPSAFLKAFKIPKSKETNYASYLQPSAGYSTLPVAPESGRGPTTEFDNPTPDEDYSKYVGRSYVDYMFNRAMLGDYYDMTRQQNLNSIRDTYPYLSQAAREAAQRNYDYSLSYALQKQQFPTTVQDIASSKQMQKYYAGATANDALRAMADANTSAVNFAQASIPRLGRGG